MGGPSPAINSPPFSVKFSDYLVLVWPAIVDKDAILNPIFDDIHRVLEVISVLFQI